MTTNYSGSGSGETDVKGVAEAYVAKCKYVGEASASVYEASADCVYYECGDVGSE